MARSPRLAQVGAPTIPGNGDDRGPAPKLTGQEAWREELYDATPERQGELFSTISGLENEPLYSPDNVEVDYDRDLGYPGVYPYTRGVYPSMYRGKLWTMRQFAGFGTAEETNERFRYLLDHGQTGISTAFDMPSLMGYDSDHPRSLGEVGREGVAIDSLADMETLFDGIPARRGLHLDDDQLRGGDAARRSTSASASSRAFRATSCAGRSRRTSSRSTSRRRNGSSRPSRRCGSSWT